MRLLLRIGWRVIAFVTLTPFTLYVIVPLYGPLKLSVIEPTTALPTAAGLNEPAKYGPVVE